MVPWDLSTKDRRAGRQKRPDLDDGWVLDQPRTACFWTSWMRPKKKNHTLFFFKPCLVRFSFVCSWIQKSGNILEQRWRGEIFPLLQPSSDSSMSPHWKSSFKFKLISIYYTSAMHPDLREYDSRLLRSRNSQSDKQRLCPLEIHKTKWCLADAHPPPTDTCSLSLTSLHGVFPQTKTQTQIS